MKMVAASRLRRAQERITHARPYAIEMLRVLNSLALRVDPSAHPLLDQRKTPRAGGKSLLIAVTADRGLCGSFNTNAIKAASTFIVENPSRQVALGLVGRRGRDYFARRGFEVRYEQVNLFAGLQFSSAKEIADAAVEAFTSGQVDSVYLVYNEFKSVMQQRVVIEPLLPLTSVSAAEEEEGAKTDYLYEPSPERILDVLLVQLVQAQILRALVESNAAFFAAQMTAMDAATRNSSDMIEALTLYMNKLRQAAITREIIEVVSGAQAL